VAPLAAHPLRIAFLTSSRFWRGSSSVFAVLARGLNARGHATVALVAYEPLAAGFRARELAVQTLPVGHTSWRGARALRHALRELAVDVVLVDRARDIRLAAVAALRRPLRIVYCISTPGPPRDPLTRLAFRRVGLTVFLTHGLARTAFAEAPFMRRAPHRVIPNGVDCDLFRPDPGAGQTFRARHRLGDGPLLVGVGALEIEKRWDLLLDSLALLRPPAPRLVLCGSGALAEPLRVQAHALHVEVSFVGQLDAAELVGAYNAASCVVHTRPDEVFALVLIEALACGRPVVAADGGGTRELLGAAGVVAPSGNPEGFARALGDLLQDAPRRVALGEAARRRALERYSVGRLVRDYADALESLGAAPRSGAPEGVGPSA
jgi:glycosyltransferase involved in cell wall biosynthesis